MNDRSTLIGIGIGLLILLLLLIGYMQWNRDGVDDTEGNDTITDDTAPAPSPTPPSGGTTPGAGDAAKAARYTQALATYQYQVQLDDCKAKITPAQGTLVIKKGVNFMVDNRDPVPHTLVIKGKTYKVGASDFIVIGAPEVGEYRMTCDGEGSIQFDVQG